MTGLLGGGHAIYFDAPTGRARNLDCFVAVPGLGAEPRHAELLELEILFGNALVHYSVGIASCGVPGASGGARRASRGSTDGCPGRGSSSPRCAWPGRRRVPAGPRRLPGDARAGDDDERGRAHLRARRASSSPRARGSSSPVSCGRSSSWPRKARAAPTTGTLARGAARADGRARRARHARGPARVRGPLVGARRGRRTPGTRFLTRGGLSDLAETARRGSRACAGSSPPSAPSRSPAALDGPDAEGDTTNLTVVDAEGSACVLTTSLGLGSGDFVPGLDLHLNSMLGETDLIRGPLEPGERMGSMMAPSLALDGDGVVLAAGAAGGRGCAARCSRSSRGSSTRGSTPRPRSRGRGSTRRTASSTSSRASSPRRSPTRSRTRATRCAPGRSGTTTSAASARWREPAAPAIRGEAGPPGALGWLDETPAEPPGRAARPDAASSVAHVPSRERTLPASRPRNGIAPRRRAPFCQTLLGRTARPRASARRRGRSARPAPPRSRTAPRRAGAARAGRRAARP